jgi:malic enzyme
VLQKYLMLAELAARNQTLFYFVVIHNLEELAPIIYTPVVGEACTNYDRLYRCAPLCPAHHDFAVMGMSTHCSEDGGTQRSASFRTSCLLC